MKQSSLRLLRARPTKESNGANGCSAIKQRIRDVKQGPDGYLHVLTEEEDAALLKIEPAA